VGGSGTLKRPFDFTKIFPQKEKTHAAGQSSDWACKPIPGEAKNWTKLSSQNLLETAPL
jgi:hypothetical protein